MMFVEVPEGVPAGAVTWTEIVQVPGVVIVPAGMVPPDKLTVRGRVMVTVPLPQVVDAEPGTIANTVPGKVSETFTPV